MTESAVEYDQIIEILEDILGEPRKHNDYNGQISFDCPVCSHEIKGLDHGDGKGNLEVNYHLGIYRCWACSDTHNTHGILKWLIQSYGTPKHLKLFEILWPDEVKERERIYESVKLPQDFILFSSASEGLKKTHYYREAKNYLDKRNVTDDLIKRFNIGFCYQGEYKFRIIIPSYDDNYRLNYFIGRSYLSNPVLKYKNPQAKKDEIIWNEHLIDWNKPVYIVEGAFDSIFLPNSIPMLGKVMSEKLFALLYMKAKEIVVICDGDAWENTQKIYWKLNGGKLFGKIWAVKLPIDKDIADLQGKLEDYNKIQL